jgi:two-component system NtrC family sensor kinase
MDVDPKLTARAQSPSSTRSLAAAGAESMRLRLDELVSGLRSAIEDLAAFPGELGDALDEKLSLALDAAEDVRDGIGHMSFVARAEGEAAKELDVHESLELALRMTRGLVGSRARLVKRYERVAAVRADKTALMRVFAQLLQNAVDAVPPYMPLANTIAVRTYEELDGTVVVEIADTGVGMAPETLARVFDPFFTTKSGAADGLGLTIARAEVLAAGGTLTAESVEGRGSRFVVRLPAIAGAGASIGSLERVFSSELPRRRGMVISDDAATAERLRALFEDDRTVLAIARIDEAIERLGMGEACDLVIVDAEEATRTQLREHLAEVAPDALMRTFELGPTAAMPKRERVRSGLWSVAKGS